ncbi:TrkH family potassium uptake protein [Thalassoglobus sp. JC818]|uniref:TrkH family potassium uptake protein n=1 Tax=Thalassoglobus sp. JC818 TaxID=3232136 RepID=UPI003459F13B
MNWPIVARMLGLLGLLVGASMAFSLPWAFPAMGQVETFEARGFWGLVFAMLCSLAISGALYAWGHQSKSSILRKEAFATVGMGWILAGVLGALPFLFSGSERSPGVKMTPIDAFFESVSGFTTTGASLLTELEDPEVIPRCIMFWRCFTHWLGGMGIIVLFVAILGQLGAGGKAMLKREVPGPITESVRPRVQESAIVMWTIYVVFSGIETVLLMSCGVSLYESLCHTFGTMATGGFSTHNSSVGFYNGGPVEFIIIIFMLLAGVNFSLYYLVFRRHHKDSWTKRLKHLTSDAELRAYLMIILVVTILLTISLMVNGYYRNLFVALQHSLFATVSIITTTGFGTEDFSNWSEFAKGLLFLLMFVGGCAGSTAGGIKVIRWVLLGKIFILEIEKSFRPNVVRPLRLGGIVVEERIRHDVVVYFCMVMVIFLGSWLLLITIEPDDLWKTHGEHGIAEKLLDCGTAVAATLNNVGPGLGVIGPTENFSNFSQQGKWLLTMLMLLGRLELFAILVLLTPRFWRQQ